MTATQRPTSLTVLAIFHFIFGGLGLLCSAFGLVGKAAGLDQQNQANAAQSPDQKELQEIQKRVEARLEKEVPFQSIRQTVAPIYSILLCVLLVVAGLGLWNMAGWARPVNVAYAILSLIFSLISLVYLFAWEWPITNDALQNETGKGQAVQMFKSIMPMAMYGALGIGILVMLYPLITLIVIFLPSTRLAFSGKSAAGDPYDSYPDQRLSTPDYDERRSGRSAGESDEGFMPK